MDRQGSEASRGLEAGGRGPRSALSAAGAAAVALLGVAVGARDRRLLLLPAVAGAFLVRHALGRRRDDARRSAAAATDAALAERYDRYAG
jgi:hypothetical protein